MKFYVTITNLDRFRIIFYITKYDGRQVAYFSF